MNNKHIVVKIHMGIAFIIWNHEIRMVNDQFYFINIF